jgi:hypothetical protein
MSTCEADIGGDGRSSTEKAQDQIEPVVQLRPILEAREKHGPIFRRELFDAAYVAYLSINDNDPSEVVYMKDGRQKPLLRTEATLLDIYGIKRKFPILREGIKSQWDNKSFVGRRAWRYDDLQGLGYRYGKAEHEQLLPFSFSIRYDALEEKCHSIGANFHDKTVAWRSEWEVSELYCHLTTFLEEHAGRTAQRVDQIICFGLNCPVASSEYPIQSRRSYFQHLAACTIRDIFARKQGGTVPKIYAQDPVYTSAGTTYLQEHLDISVLPDPEGFKALDGHTFVMSVSPNVPVRQVALDMTDESGGPAGFFCNNIHSHGLEYDGKGMIHDTECKKTPYYTCNPSPGLWEFKQRGIWTEYDDQKILDCFENMGVYLKKETGKMS